MDESKVCCEYADPVDQSIGLQSKKFILDRDVLDAIIQAIDETFVEVE